MVVLVLAVVFALLGGLPLFRAAEQAMQAHAVLKRPFAALALCLAVTSTAEASGCLVPVLVRGPPSARVALAEPLVSVCQQTFVALSGMEFATWDRTKGRRPLFGKAVGERVGVGGIGDAEELDLVDYH